MVEDIAATSVVSAKTQKAKCLYEVIFFLYSIGYLDHSVHSPSPLLPFLLGG